ncbi:MAG: hypothetical protein IPI55_00190 [Flavobacteriales bacterium]|nr:hypothetical protein [Flavobacteriales bacterium]
MGEAKEVERVEIVWPDGRVHFLRIRSFRP